MVAGERISAELPLLVRWKLKNVTYSLVDGPEEVDLVLERIGLGFKFHLVHVGSINILERRGCAGVERLERGSTRRCGLILFIIPQKYKEFAPSSEAQTHSLQLHVC